jgi:hypothetical protein
MQPVSRWWINKHLPTAMNMHTAIELLFEVVFYARSVQNDYKEGKWGEAAS